MGIANCLAPALRPSSLSESSENLFPPAPPWKLCYPMASLGLTGILALVRPLDSTINGTLRLLSWARIMLGLAGGL